MAWITGYRIDGGALAGSVFDGGGGDLDDPTWVNYPNPSATGFTVASGTDMTTVWSGVACMNLLKEKTVGDTFTLWTIDIIDPSEYKVELRFHMRCFRVGGFECELIRRVYTDDTTYSDTTLVGRSLGFYFNDPNLNTSKVNAVFFQSSYNGTSYFYIGFSWQDEIYWSGQTTCSADGFSIPFARFADVMGGDLNGEEFSPEFGPAETPEGYDGGSFDYSSDFIDMPSKPQSVLSLGFVNVYKCAANALVDFGAALFPEIQFPQSLTDVGEVIAAVSDSIWNSKLIDYVISVHCVPGDVTAGALEDIKVGARTMTGISARKITDEYYDFDFGTLHTDPIYKNFVDQRCEAELYLPFYGFISLKPEQWNGGDISVKYRFNVIDGSFTAFVFSKPAKSEMTKAGLIGQYGGSCVVHLPITGNSYASMFSGLIGGAAQAASGVASGNINAVGGAMTALESVGSGGDAKMSNSYNASASFMTRRKPYLLISAPVPAFSTRYNIENGLPTNQAMVLGTLTGLVKASNPILDGIPCTDNEREKIRAALANGLIF